MVWITNGDDFTSTQVEHYVDLRELNRSFSDLAGFAGYGVGDRELTGFGEPERLSSLPVTANFFSVLGVQPAIGRMFTAEESQGAYRAPPAVLLTYNFWQRRFASDPQVVGQKLTLNNQPTIVAGVLPASFDFGSVFAPGSRVDLYSPFPLTPETNRWGNTLSIVGRLKAGASVQSAQADTAVLGARRRRRRGGGRLAQAIRPRGCRR